jgi:hypothetical protein
MADSGYANEMSFIVRRDGKDEVHRVWIREPALVGETWECVFQMTEFGSPKIARGVSASQALYAARYIATGAYSALDKRGPAGAPFEWPWPLPIS